MVYLITRHWCPTHVVKEVVKKLFETIPKFSEFQSNFLDIENYEYSIDVFNNTEEFLAMIGMKLPE